MFVSLTEKKLEEDEVQIRCDAVLDHILKYSSPDMVYLFGSCAEGRATQGSDLDVALVFSSEAEKKLKSQILNHKLSFPVDFLFFTKEYFKSRAKGFGVCAVIADTGKIIYSKEGTKW